MKIIRSPFFRYTAVILLFGVWILFFDDYSYCKQREMNKHLAELQKTLQETKNAIVACEAKNEKMNGMEAIEAAGRENYYMKRDDEVVFIFLKEENGELLLLE